jgi:Dyp-type peroxidase family
MSVDARRAMAVSRSHPQAPEEPLLDGAEIQGNIVPGFMKPLQSVLGLRITDSPQARVWLHDLVPQVTTMDQVMPSRMKVRAARLSARTVAGHTDVVGQLDDLWLNVALSFAGMCTLQPASAPFEADKFVDEAFAVGLAGRSAVLGDPTEPGTPGHPSTWVVGGPGNEADVLLVFGADRTETMQARFEEVKSSAQASGLDVVHEEHGGKLDAVGHEQFGFQDGISQPGVRGRFASDPQTFVTPRTVDRDVVPESWLYGLPGQYLVWPGAFVFGYPVPGVDPLLAGPATIPGPLWARNGSYLVYRRLRQDVALFRSFLTEQSAALAMQDGFEGTTATQLGAMVVGRWPSGAPLARAPHADDPDLGADPLENNHVEFAADTPELPLIDGPRPAYPCAHADPVGITTPLAAHIRKVNVRDVGSDQGGRRASFARRILRRGLPFGPPMPPSGPDPANGNRGLMFLSYQTSITDQFEFLNTAWMGDPVAPRAPSGHDMLVGQNGQPGEQRKRDCVFLSPDGDVGHVTAQTEWVIPTGGGYFFSPSISALRDVIGTASVGDDPSH